MKEENQFMDQEAEVKDNTEADELEETAQEETAAEDDEQVDGKNVSEEQEEIEKLKQEVEEWKNRSLRAQADLDNVRRRTKEEKEKAAKYRAQDLIESLLPVLDNFERAISVKPETEEAVSLHEGVNMVYTQLFEAVQKEGLEVIETEGQVFDPEKHQAVMQVEEEGFDSNQIVEELQKGYQLKDKVIRPAMVKVNA
ncbi:molecular chaperone GrpE [Alteribacillus persepolensis]|uniref:Protein GrpE n=1 Tax=Alteribacillus persepolensis TaxID=568899 RepID=A0A1G8CQV3_9BACI|nr:nucleotide exchange factor GrpE [Alteribacillus persepolensis]SDH47290.1 molecular chaperone GrpE [Alteribacillus persepolensis]